MIKNYNILASLYDYANKYTLLDLEEKPFSVSN